MVQGQWKEILGFPNNGKDFIDSGNFDSFTIKSLHSRETKLFLDKQGLARVDFAPKLEECVHWEILGICFWTKKVEIYEYD